MPDYDAIVIGSGMGGLTFASVMAQMKGWRVLVLERHFKLGGFTHTFTRPGGYEWDVGIHYVGEMAAGERSRSVMDFVTGGSVKWSPLPDAYDVCVYPGLRFPFVKGEQNFRSALISQFPAEENAIDQYLRDTRKAADWMTRFALADSLPARIGGALRKLNLWMGKLGMTTTGEYMRANFRDERLRGLLVSQWGDYGLPPARSAFAMHSLIVRHYLEGAWYPEGGAGVIAAAATQVIRSAGGDLQVNQDVQRVLIENGHACGVEVASKGTTRQFRAPVVVSNAGAWTTFNKLAPGLGVDLDWDSSGFSVVTLYLGLKRDPHELGFKGENHWLMESFDHDAIAANSAELAQGKAQFGYLSFPSLKNPRAGAHTAEIISALPYEVVAQYRDLPWRRRGAEYAALKARMSDALLGLVEKHYPGFRDLVAYQEMSTPLTDETFTGYPRGEIYGYPCTPERYRKSFLRPTTPLPGLYLTGADALSLGITGAMMSGVVTAGLALGPAGFLRIMAATRKPRKALGTSREAFAATTS